MMTRGGAMNGCKKTDVYYCKTRRFNKDHCDFFKDADLGFEFCEHYEGGFCTSRKAKKHADGHGQKHPKPTEPCHQWYQADPNMKPRIRNVMRFRDDRLGFYDIDLCGYIFPSSPS